MNVIGQLRNRARWYLKALELWRLLANRTGWYRSLVASRPIDADNNPLPWYTYPAIEFLRSYDLGNSRVFEFGAGNSTLFWAKRSREVYAVESDPTWLEEIKKEMPSNVHLIAGFDQQSYLSAAVRAEGRFGIVVVDGLYREEAAKVALEIIDPTGFIIVDNAELHEGACRLLRERGWTQINFSGHGPINPYFWVTALFLRTEATLRYNSSFYPVGHH